LLLLVLTAMEFRLLCFGKKNVDIEIMIFLWSCLFICQYLSSFTFKSLLATNFVKVMTEDWVKTYQIVAKPCKSL